MNFLKYEIDADDGDVVVVELDHAANVRLMDASNFYRYRRGQSHHFYGGQQIRTPARLAVPHAGHWYVTIDLGGHRGTIRARVSVMRSGGFAGTSID